MPPLYPQLRKTDKSINPSIHIQYCSTGSRECSAEVSPARQIYAREMAKTSESAQPPNDKSPENVLLPLSLYEISSWLPPLSASAFGSVPSYKSKKPSLIDATSARASRTINSVPTRQQTSTSGPKLS